MLNRNHLHTELWRQPDVPMLDQRSGGATKKIAETRGQEKAGAASARKEAVWRPHALRNETNVRKMTGKREKCEREIREKCEKCGFKVAPAASDPVSLVCSISI